MPFFLGTVDGADLRDCCGFDFSDGGFGGFDEIGHGKVGERELIVKDLTVNIFIV